MAARVGRSIRSTMVPVAQDFLGDRPFIIVASVDAKENVWASILTGGPGFIRIIDEGSLEFEAGLMAEDILGDNLRSNPKIGILAIEFATRMRMRLNGRAEFTDERVVVRAEEVFSNCPKYIQARSWKKREFAAGGGSTIRRSKKPTPKQKKLIEKADTFFIASRQTEGGADASHRGGNPGFVRFLDESTLIFPDYSGNMMFQTLGNIEQNPHGGLLFIDFKTGTTLQLSGKAGIIWDEKLFSQFSGAERAVQFEIEKIIERKKGVPFSWEFLSYSPANPE